MKLRDVLLCVDCDEVFTAEGHTCNPRCPSCGSSIFAPLACWLQTWTAFEKSKDEANGVTRYGPSTKERRMEIIHPKPFAA